MPKVLAVIPARYASTRFPGKPLFPIAGVPLLRRVWERCRKARTIDRLVIATDDARIWRAASQWGAEVVLTSKDHLSGTDRVAEVARTARDCVYIINIQGDEPLIEPRVIDGLVRLLKSKPQIEMVTAAHPLSRPSDVSSPNQVKVTIDKSGRALDFSRQSIPGHPPDEDRPPNPGDPFSSVTREFTGSAARHFWISCAGNRRRERNLRRSNNCGL